MQPTGGGKRSILVIAESPSTDDDEAGTHFVGQSGQFLEERMARVGISLRDDCWMHYAVICHPTTRDGSRRAANENEQTYCMPNVKKAIDELKPKVIVTLGHYALGSVVDGIWTEPLQSVARWAGWQIPCQKYNAWICPLYSPGYVMTELAMAKGRPVAVSGMFDRHVKAIKRLKERPWVAVPNYKNEIEVIFDEKQVVQYLHKFTKRGGPISFDYETNMLKPEHKDARIYAVSICWHGRKTIAFPFGGRPVRNALRRLLTAGHPLISQNLKFEDRWSRIKLGITPTTWAWDTMNQGHVLDNRDWGTALDFQTFVHLGFGSWNAGISEFLEADGSYQKNQIHKIDFSSLCLYCGTDSYVTYLLAQKQRKLMNLEPL
jgi:uracil-DNA glycosylase family 4